MLIIREQPEARSKSYEANMQVLILLLLCSMYEADRPSLDSVLLLLHRLGEGDFLIQIGA